MSTIIEYGIQFGEWITNHTLVPYPYETTAMLAVVVVLLYAKIWRELWLSDVRGKK